MSAYDAKLAKTCDIGVIGLAVMGENLILNMNNKGFKVAVFNRTVAKVDNFLNDRAKGTEIVGCHSFEEFAAALKSPRKIMLMVQAGKPVDLIIESALPHLEKGDILIDGGNSHYLDTARRYQYIKEKGLHYVGAGVSGGEEGALNGPSIMPGGAKEAWPAVQPILQGISAKADDGSPCCYWVGDSGSGHFVKAKHNAIEYGDIQIINEGYSLMKNLLQLSNQEMHQHFKEWNEGDLKSYLIEITRDILAKKDDETGAYLLDLILDTAGQKGTGKWMAATALDLGVPVTLIAESVFARCLSALKDERVHAAKILAAPTHREAEAAIPKNKPLFLSDLGDALFAAKIISYAQGFALLKAAAKEHHWALDYASIALMWRNGCIIRAGFLENIADAFKADPELNNLMLNDYFKDKLAATIPGMRRVVVAAFQAGIPVPALSSALAYYDGYRCERLPANLLQAQRDYFGAHMFERTDKPRGEFFHCDWTGHGGKTTSNTYNK